MARKRILPPTPRLLQLADQMTYQQIADMYQVKRQSVSDALKGVVEPRYRRQDWPWDIEPRHKTGWLYHAASYYLTSLRKQQPLSDRQHERLASFLNMLDELPGEWVVDYFPESAAGLQLRERRPGDDPDSILAPPRNHTQSA